MEILPLRIRVCARAGCFVGDEVWFALQTRGLSVYNSETYEHLTDIELAIDGCASPQLKCLIPVFNEVWATTFEGGIICVGKQDHRITRISQIPGSENNAQLVDIFSNGHLVLVASESGCALALDVYKKEVLFSIPTKSPCTAVVQFSSVIFMGDRFGVLYLFDALTQKCLDTHADSESEILKLLYEPRYNRLWVARRNAKIDLYNFDSGNNRLFLYTQVRMAGIVTGMVPLGASVAVSTSKRQLVIMDASSTHILHTSSNVHKTFIHDIIRVCREGNVQLWSLGNDNTVHVCSVNDSIEPVSTLPRASAVVLNKSPKPPCNLLEKRNNPPTNTSWFDPNKLFDTLEDLRRAHEEACEMRLRSERLEALLKVKDNELEIVRKESKDLADRVSMLTKNVGDLTSEKQSMERERMALQSELNFVKSDLLHANALSSNQMADKLRAEEEVSRQKANLACMEQHLREVEVRLSAVQAENKRLQESAGNSTIAKGVFSEAQSSMVASQAQPPSEMERILRLNYSLNSLLKSIVYTLYRKEERERDLVALLNAYRLKAADHVGDSHLCALLIATVTRHPDRFEMVCNSPKLMQLRNYSSPFISFLNSLQSEDPEGYRRLMQYLYQQPAISSTLTQPQQELDQLLASAFKEGDLIGEAALAAFKQSISTFTTCINTVGLAPNTQAQVAVQKPFAEETVATNGTTTASPQDKPSILSGITPGRVCDAQIPLKAPPSVDTQDARTKCISCISVTASVGENGSPTCPSQTSTSKVEIEEYRSVFEFLLYTRRPLAQYLAFLHQQTSKLKQKVEASCLEAFAAMMTSPILSSASISNSSQEHLSTTLQAIKLLTVEIDNLVSFVLSNYLTTSEKRRLGLD